MNLHQIRIDHRSKQPLYQQIEQNLRELVVRGQLPLGQALPPETELAGLYRVNRLTIRRAVDELVRQRWLVRRRGVGTFVTRPAIAAIAPAKFSFTEEMLAIGRRPSSRPINQVSIPANQEVAWRLEIQEGDPVIELTRVRLADEEPLLLETSYLPHSRFPQLDREPLPADGSLYAYLQEEYGVSVTGMDQTLKPVLLTPEQAAHLEVQAGAPAIVSEIVAYSSTGEPVEYSWSVASGDKCEFYFRFRHGSQA
jgi:GntR family transcriptional regulator